MDRVGQEPTLIWNDTCQTVLFGFCVHIFSRGLGAGGFDWDPRTLTAKGNDKAQPLLRRPYLLRLGCDAIANPQQGRYSVPVGKAINASEFELPANRV